MINRKLVEIPVRMMNRMEEITDLICEYNEEVQKQQQEIERLNNIISELEKDIDSFDVFKEFSFPLMKRWEEEQVKSSIDYEWRKAIKEPFLNKIKELKGVDKE